VLSSIIKGPLDDGEEFEVHNKVPAESLMTRLLLIKFEVKGGPAEVGKVGV